jgi:hypothetical protein
VKRRSVAYVAGELRRIGRDLVTGAWDSEARKPRTMSTPQALATMAEAMAFVVEAGVGSVFERAKQTLADLVDVEELDFDK